MIYFKSKKVFFILLILNIIAISYCSSTSEIIKNPNVINLSEKDYNSTNYDIKYFFAPLYFYKSKQYKYIKKYELTQNQAKSKSQYFKVYYKKNTKKISRVDEYLFHKLGRINLFEYYPNGNTKQIKSYLENKPVDLIYHFKNNTIIRASKINLSGVTSHIGKVRYLKIGIQISWYTLYNQIVSVAFYNKHYQLVRQAYYKNGILDYFIDYRYDQNKFLRGQEEYDRYRRPIRFRVFVYDADGYVIKSKNYNGKRVLHSETQYDKQGRKTRINVLDNNRKIVAYNTVNYQQESFEEKWFDRYDRITERTIYHNDGQVKESSKYDPKGEESFKMKNEYKNGIINKKIIYSYEKKMVEHLYNDKGLLVKSIKYIQDRISAIVNFFYNKKFQITQTIQYNSYGMKLGTWKYHYNKSGLVIGEDFFDKFNKLVYRHVYFYDKLNNVSQIRIFNQNLKLVQVKHFKNKLLIKLELGRNGKLYKTIKYKYNRRLQVVKEEYFDEANQLVNYSFFKYNKFGRRIQEDGYDRRGQYLGTIIFKYYNNGKLHKELRFNHLKKLFLEIIYNQSGQVIERNKINPEQN